MRPVGWNGRHTHTNMLRYTTHHLLGRSFFPFLFSLYSHLYPLFISTFYILLAFLPIYVNKESWNQELHKITSISVNPTDQPHFLKSRLNCSKPPTPAIGCNEQGKRGRWTHKNLQILLLVLNSISCIFCVVIYLFFCFTTFFEVKNEVNRLR